MNEGIVNAIRRNAKTRATRAELREMPLLLLVVDFDVLLLLNPAGVVDVGMEHSLETRQTCDSYDRQAMMKWEGGE